MTIEDQHKLFNLILDKVQSPYLESNQIDFFLQRGEITYVTSFFDKSQDGYNAEGSSVDSELLSPLFNEVTVQSNSEGRVLFSDISTEINGTLMYVLSASRSTKGVDDCGAGDYKKSRFVRHNDFGVVQPNSFKKASTEYPIHRYFNQYMKFDPAGKTNVYFVVLKEPVKVTLDDPNDIGVRGVNAVDSEFSNKAQNAIVYHALQAAGISIREWEFKQAVDGEEQQNI